MAKIILITGSSSGMGLDAALLLAGKGHKVYASMRNMGKAKLVKEAAKNAKVSLETIELDVTEPQTIKTAIKEIISKEGKLNVLINNAGFGVVGPFETLSENDIEKQFEVNYFGCIKCIQEVLPQMRKQKSGTIVNVSSVAGTLGLAFWSAYCSTKFALEGLTESIKLELQPFGIDVKLVEPGPVATEFDQDMVMGSRKLEKNPYSKTIKKTFESFKEMLQKGQSSKAASEAYVKAVEDTSNQFRFQTSDQAKMMVLKKFKDPTGYATLL
jgi:short-subunit dehydrogenase